jgi:hypothetical protein
VPAALDRLGLPTGTKFGDPITDGPAGTVALAAYLDYRYKYADPQGLMKFYGRAYVYTRQDKSVVILGRSTRRRRNGRKA